MSENGKWGIVHLFGVLAIIYAVLWIISVILEIVGIDIGQNEPFIGWPID